MWSETWPRAGMTRNGIAFRLRPSVPRTSVGGCFLWPTPTDMSKGGSTSRGGKRVKELLLLGMVKQYAPIRAAYLNRASSEEKDESKSRNLKELAERATAHGPLNPTWIEWLMGFPQGWTALEDSETPSSLK
jgi:hypothetical protein